MDSELIIFAAVILIVAVVAVWRDPRSAGQVIKDIFTQFSKREKPNDFKRDDEDGDGDRL
jgi:hypothetical protein